MVEHLAGGTQATVLSYQDGQWQRHEVVPLLESQTGHYAVVKLRMGRSQCDITYKVADNSTSQEHQTFFLCTLRIDARSGLILHRGPERKISSDTYMRAALRRRR